MKVDLSLLHTAAHHVLSLPSLSVGLQISSLKAVMIHCKSNNLCTSSCLLQPVLVPLGQLSRSGPVHHPACNLRCLQKPIIRVLLKNGGRTLDKKAEGGEGVKEGSVGVFLKLNILFFKMQIMRFIHISKIDFPFQIDFRIFSVNCENIRCLFVFVYQSEVRCSVR